LWVCFVGMLRTTRSRFWCTWCMYIIVCNSIEDELVILLWYLYGFHVPSCCSKASFQVGFHFSNFIVIILHWLINCDYTNLDLFLVRKKSSKSRNTIQFPGIHQPSQCYCLLRYFYSDMDLLYIVQNYIRPHSPLTFKIEQKQIMWKSSSQYMHFCFSATTHPLILLTKCREVSSKITTSTPTRASWSLRHSKKRAVSESESEGQAIEKWL
jgi:hypothetical protein